MLRLQHEFSWKSASGYGVLFLFAASHNREVGQCSAILSAVALAFLKLGAYQ